MKTYITILLLALATLVSAAQLRHGHDDSRHLTVDESEEEVLKEFDGVKVVSIGKGKLKKHIRDDETAQTKPKKTVRHCDRQGNCKEATTSDHTPPCSVRGNCDKEKERDSKYLEPPFNPCCCVCTELPCECKCDSGMVNRGGYMKFGDIKGESKEDQAEARRKKATDDDAHREEKEAERLAAKAERDARKKARKEQRQAEREAERQKKEMAAKVIRSDQEKAKRTKEKEESTEGEVEKPATRRRRHLCEGEDQDCDEEAPVDTTVEELPPPCEGEGCEILETTAVEVPEIEDEVVSYNAPSMLLCCCKCTNFPCACQCDGSSQPEPMPLIESQEEETDPEQMVGEGADPIPDEMENEP